MPQLRHTTVDGAQVTIGYADGFGRVGPFQSDAHFDIGRRRPQLIGSAALGFADGVRSRADLAPDLREIETRRVEARRGTVESAVVERTSGGLVDPVEVTRFSITVLEGRHGCLHMTGDLAHRDDDIALLAGEDVTDAPDGMTLGRPVDASVRVPVATVHIAGGGVTMIRPLTEQSAAQARAMGEPQRTAAGAWAYEGSGRTPSIVLFGRDTMTHVVQSAEDEDIERLADQLEVAWVKS